MKKLIKTWLIAAAISVGPAFHVIASAVMQVQVRETQLRATPSFLGKITATGAYGEQADIRETRGDWKKIVLPEGREGWVHNSALTSQKLVLQAGRSSVQTTASGDELALAGKGFNSDVEAEFKQQNRDIDFTWVDKMETFTCNPGQIRQFLKDGGIVFAGGGE